MNRQSTIFVGIVTYPTYEGRVLSVMVTQQRIALDGASLTVPEVNRIAHGVAGVSVPQERMTALESVRQRLIDARESGYVYGANTGVGANRNVVVSEDADGQNDAAAADIDGERAAHARRLLLSHCAATGPVEGDAVSRATMAVRLNQFAAGGSGVSSGVARGLLAALDSGSLPTLHGLGSVGMGDLPALAELALTLAGERPWRTGGIDPVQFTDTDALPFMSSSAVTLATAALGAGELDTVLRSGVVVAALSLLALEGSSEAYDDDVHRRRAHPHQRAVAAAVAHLAGMDDGMPREAARIQDPFGLRVFPQVHAPAVHALDQLVQILETDINAAAENPLITAHGVAHHGQFHLGALAAALDHARTAFFPVLTLSSARLGMMLRPDMTRLPAFLAQGPPGSSGLMIAEYVVQDVLANLRTAVVPVSGASLSISLGLEDHAGFATQGARLLRRAAAEAPVVVAVEAVAAVRALRLAPQRLGNTPARAAFEYLADQLDPDMEDRPIGEDIDRAVALLPGLAGFLGDSL